MPTAFQIQINEAQRAALEKLVMLHPEMTGDNGPLEYWPEMLAGLPADEAAHPGSLHGFCL